MSRSKFFALIILAGTALAAPVFAYVSPGTPTGYVNDFADVVSAETEFALNQELSSFAAEGGGEIAVVTIPTLQGDDIESYANTLFREWGVGLSENNTGILLLIAVEDREMRIEVGYGYEGVVPDAYASRIIRDDITPRFREGDYDAGIRNGVTSLLTLIRDPSSSPPPEAEPLTFEDWATLGGFVFVLISWLLAIMARTKSWWLGGIFGGIISIVLGFVFSLAVGLMAAIPLIALGFLIDFAVSSAYREAKASGVAPPWWTGGGGSWGGGSSGGFGGFGGGSSGGGGASGSW